MNTIYILPKPEFSFKDADEQAEIHELMCKCGHKFYMHAFVMLYDNIADCNYYITSQCISCGYDDETEKFICERFERAEG